MWRPKRDGGCRRSCARFFSNKEMIHLYKAQVLSFIESSTPGIFHTAPSTLERVDRVQRKLRREIGISEIEALRNYKLTTLPSRRDMVMLGLVHRIALGLAPPQLASLLPVRGMVSEPARRKGCAIGSPCATSRSLHLQSFEALRILIDKYLASLYAIISSHNA